MTQYEKDLEVMLSFNGKPMSRGHYNLLVSKRDVALFCKGIKPHKNWRLSDVKAYFGLKGSKESVLKQLQERVGSVLNVN
jgi:hypothetical protein